ncbi:hypothetical protein Sango_2978400 [Sesamum angolense]|uniref:SWIM-type domain-containing protein n=1 Tax=Sesamum angolense TaxID=2727404 RepID=A0AAE1VZF1_9LAMI|nr:hypothetical protein Sango_2978400 [Sesamum angolense]
MTLLATPGLPSCSNTDYLAGTSNPDFDAGTSNPDFGAEDPIGDSFVNESDEASEPVEAEYPFPPEDGPDYVDINVMAETVAQGGAETSSEPVLPDRTTQPIFYRSVLFFEQTFPEIPADSVDIPNLRDAKFYNKSEGRLDVGMLFKTKEELMEAVQDHSDQTGYDVPYQKAWYSLKKAREIVYGTWESSVRKLPKYLGAIQKYNTGTIVEWKYKAFQQSTGSYVLGYVFWAFKSCIDRFQFCRKIISVDDTHLYTKYKHKLLIAAAIDGNQQVLPLAFAIVDEETYPSCGIIKAVRDGPNFLSPHGVHRHSQQSASVVTGRQNGYGMNTHVVKNANQECSCGKWNQFGIPCSHTKKVCGAYNISAASMVKDYYDLMAYNNTYSKHFESGQLEDYWDDPNFQLVHDPTIRIFTRPGRNQTTRIHNEMDWRQREQGKKRKNKEILHLDRKPMKIELVRTNISTSGTVLPPASAFADPSVALRRCRQGRGGFGKPRDGGRGRGF